jgi:hypothetical protein
LCFSIGFKRSRAAAQTWAWICLNTVFCARNTGGGSEYRVNCQQFLVNLRNCHLQSRKPYLTFQNRNSWPIGVVRSILPRRSSNLHRSRRHNTFFPATSLGLRSASRYCSAVLVLSGMYGSSGGRAHKQCALDTVLWTNPAPLSIPDVKGAPGQVLSSPHISPFLLRRFLLSSPLFLSLLFTKFSSFFVPLSFLSIGPGSRSLLCPKLVSFFTLKVPQLQDRLSLFFRSPREPYVPRPQSFHQCRSTGHITARRNIDQASIA